MGGVLLSLQVAVAAVPGLPAPAGLGAAPVLHEQVAALTESIVVLQRELSLRMAALERQDAAATVRSDAVRRGLGAAHATRLRQDGRFAAEHQAVRQAWSSGQITGDHVAALRTGAGALPTPALRRTLVDHVLPHLHQLDAKRARSLVAYTADQLDPGCPDGDELSDHAARTLSWTGTGGGISFQGYLPAAEAEAFTAAITALAEDLRAEGDAVSPEQRRADALAALVAKAAEHGLPKGGGLPAALTLTVSLTEAERIAAKDPARFARDRDVRTKSGARAGNRDAGDAAVRFGLCCASVAPVLAEPADPADPGSALARIAGTPVQPLAVGRGARLATPAQRRALQLRDGGCAIPGCTIAAPYTQPHHVTPWSLEGRSDLDNLVSLCWVHHRQTELGRYRFQPRRNPTQPAPPGALAHPLWWIIPDRS